jgi:Zn-dependent protease with chaperone function
MPVGLLVTISIVIIAAFGWLLNSLLGLLEFTSNIVSWCKGIFLQCFGYFLILKIFLIWSGLLIAGAGLLYGVARGILDTIKANHAIMALPKADYGLGIILIKDDIQVAFTHGLLSPRVYISSGLIQSLNRHELNAVVLHELYHKRHRDPLRFLLLSILKDTFFYIPMGRYLFGLLHSLQEKAADDEAVSAMNEPFGLASALIKIARSGCVALGPASIKGFGKGFGGVEVRVKRLIERRDEGLKLPGWRIIVSSLLAIGVIFLSLALPLYASISGHDHSICSTGQCPIYMNKMEQECRSHCKI